MKKEFAKKIKEALLSALPIILIVLILHFTKIAPISNQQDFIIFLICSISLRSLMLSFITPVKIRKLVKNLHTL